MTSEHNSVSVTYTNTELRNLVEEYITQQKSDFTLKGVCSYVLYWAVEDGKVADEKSLMVGVDMQHSDQERVKRVLDVIVTDGGVAFNDVMQCLP